MPQLQRIQSVNMSVLEATEHNASDEPDGYGGWAGTKKVNPFKTKQGQVSPSGTALS